MDLVCLVCIVHSFLFVILSIQLSIVSHGRKANDQIIMSLSRWKSVRPFVLIEINWFVPCASCSTDGKIMKDSVHIDAVINAQYLLIISF